MYSSAALRGSLCGCLLLLLVELASCNTAKDKVTEEPAPSAVLERADGALAEKADALTNSSVRSPLASAALASATSPSAAPPSDAVQPVAGLGNLCDKLCERTRELNCSTELSECQSQCREMAAMPTCQEQLSAVFNCVLTHPASDWECVEGFGAIREEFCRTEQAAYAACVAHSP